MKGFVLILLLFTFRGANAQQVCFENFQQQVVQPLEAAINKAKSDQEMDSLMKESRNAFKRLEGCQMPNFEATTLKGETINKASLKGKIVVFNFWFIGCAPCVAELPALNKLAEEYKKEVVFIAFGNSNKERTLNEFLPKHAFDYHLVADAKAYADKFMVSVWPVNMVFDGNGVLKYVSLGGYTDERAKTAVYNNVSPILRELIRAK